MGTESLNTLPCAGLPCASLCEAKKYKNEDTFCTFQLLIYKYIFFKYIKLYVNISVNHKDQQNLTCTIFVLIKSYDKRHCCQRQLSDLFLSIVKFVLVFTQLNKFVFLILIYYWKYTIYAGCLNWIRRDYLLFLLKLKALIF